LNLTIVDLNKREITLKMVQYEMILELREFLTEHVYTCFFTHYYFEHAGVKLNDYTELATLDLEAEPRIYMRPERYDEKGARAHIKRVKEIIMGKPLLLSATPSKDTQAATGVLKKAEEEVEEAEKNKEESKTE